MHSPPPAADRLTPPPPVAFCLAFAQRDARAKRPAQASAKGSLSVPTLKDAPGSSDSSAAPAAPGAAATKALSVPAPPAAAAAAAGASDSLSVRDLGSGQRDDDDELLVAPMSMPVTPAYLSSPAGGSGEAGGGREAGDAGGPPAADTHNPLWYGCRSVKHYEKVNRLEEGTYGVVFKAKNRHTGGGDLG